MARMIEALRQAGGTQAQPGQPQQAAPEQAEAPAVAEEPAAVAMPYIEVGGGKALTGSADVLACPVPPRQAAAKPQPAAPHLLPLPAGLPQPASPEPALAVAFQPWPGQRPAEATRCMAPELIAFHQPHHPVSEQYRGLLDQVLGGEPGGASRVLLLTAAGPDAGTTTTLLNLAVTACAEGKRRGVVVDLNLQRPALASRLGLLAPPGLQEVFAGSVALEQALQATALPNLYALTASPPGAGQNGFLTAEGVRWLLSWLRERFDLVLVDGPPWEESPELAALATACDAIYPVLQEDAASKPSVQLALRAIARRGGRLRGLIHTHRAA